MSKYGKKTQQLIKKELHKYKHQYKWKNKKQAIAFGVSEARGEGDKVPSKKRK